MAYQIRLRVTPQELSKAAYDVTEMVNTLRRDFENLQAKVGQTRCYWTGEGGDQYRRVFSARRQETGDILDLLAKYPSDLLSMAQVYSVAEQVNVEKINSLPTDIIH